MIDRPLERLRISSALDRSPVVLLTGARQVGKTTLARTFVDSDSLAYFDLENPLDLARLSEPMTALSNLEGTVVIDEVQRLPDIFTVLRVLADRRPLRCRFLILGSASPNALRQSSESLAGRIEVLELGGLRPSEATRDTADRLWLRGGYPPSFLSRSNDDSFRWRIEYIRSLATRDLPDFGVGLPAATVQRFLALAAHAHAQLWNSAVPARALGIAETTVRKYVDILSDALIVRMLQPWHENLSKRQVKMPKFYFRDSGLAHALLDIRDQNALLRNARCGASWEGWVLECILQALDNDVRPYFWRTSTGAELDLFFERNGKRIGIEIKRADAPRMTPSMRNALSDLRLDRLLVFYPGDKRYALNESIDVVPAGVVADDPTLNGLFD